ncbi:hypothetical protein P9850_12285 [Anoxybacillus rupiensis]|uniref:TraG P-loop domain-containing protein n=1 Tax=Anoxybacteroides rupiense TaxID=311460 RepID=A0ABD5IZ04_9BACL|nr:hypothetical protein [Anoxybacillus rupiensis]
MSLSLGGLFRTRRSKNISNKKKKSQKISKSPIKEIGELIQTVDGKYKIVAKVTPVNAELLSDEDLFNVFESIQAALSVYNQGRIGIYIQSERINLETNIQNINRYQSTLDNQLKIELLEEQKKHLESFSIKSKNVLNFYIVLESSHNKYEIAKQSLEESIDSIKSELSSEDMDVIRLSETELKRMLYEQIYPETCEVETFQDEWDVYEICNPQLVINNADPRVIENDGRLYRFFSIDFYPLYVDQFRWLRRLWSMNGDISIAIMMTPKNKLKITQELSNAAKEAGAKALDKTKPLHLQKKYEKEKETAEKLIEQLGNENISLFDTNITIGISAKNRDELNALTTSLKSRISSSGCKSVDLKYKEFDPFWTVLPILADNNITRNYVWNLTNADIASLIPFDSSELMEKDGILQGENVTSKGLIIVDPYNKKRHFNAHMAIIAYSGSGKTFYVSCDAIRHTPYRDYIVMFDVEGELFFPWATKIRFSATSNFTTNPFHIRNAIIDTDGQDDGIVDVGGYLAEKIMSLMTFFKWIYPEMTSYDESLLETAIRKTYEKKQLTFQSTELPSEFPTLSTLEEVLEEMIRDSQSQKEKEHLVNMKAVFNPYINGAYSKLFNGPTNWDIDPFTILDISQLNETVRNPLYDILLRDLWQLFKIDRKKTKRLYIDEAHEFSDPKQPQTLEFVHRLVKRGRKYGLGVVTATQNLPDFLAVERYGQAIIDNSHFKLFMALGETDLPVAQKLQNFTEREMKILRQKKKDKRGKGRGIFIVGSQRIEIQTRASKFELEIVDPDQFEEIYKTPSRYRKQNNKVV